MKLSFDISSIETSDTATVDLRHPGTGELVGASIEVYGDDSQHTLKAGRAASAEYAAFAQKNNFKKVMPPEQAEEIELKKDVACIKSWKGFKNGEVVLDPTDENIRLIFAKFPAFREQVKEARTNRALFIKG